MDELRAFIVERQWLELRTSDPAAFQALVKRVIAHVDSPQPRRVAHEHRRHRGQPGDRVQRRFVCTRGRAWRAMPLGREAASASAARQYDHQRPATSDQRPETRDQNATGTPVRVP